MARNIELKARVDDLDAVLQRAQSLADRPAPETILQDDRFYRCSDGRLKLRVFADGRGELIHYRRADAAGPALSDYVRVPTEVPALLDEALARAHGRLGRVVKRRWLLMQGATRIHLDRVEGLGDFVELEVVLRDGEPEADGRAQAERLLAALGIAPAQRVAVAYVDLLTAAEEAAS